MENILTSLGSARREHDFARKAQRDAVGEKVTLAVEHAIAKKLPLIIFSASGGAHIYAELVGYGANCDAYHFTAPAPGGAGGVEAVFTALALHDSFVPPTVGYQVPDPACDLDYVPGKGREKPLRYAMSNSLGFGGHNACLLLKKWEG